METHYNSKVVFLKKSLMLTNQGCIYLTIDIFTIYNDNKKLFSVLIYLKI